MSRLIDADATKRRVADTFFDTLIPCVNRALDDSPTVDAVHVVRCRDCKHRFEDSWCEYVDDDDNFYCARGERKEGADNS